MFLAYGDSITAGYGATAFPFDLYSIPHSGYVGRLYEDLKDDFKQRYPQQDIVFYNMGIGGQTTRMDWTFSRPPSPNRYRPVIMIPAVFTHPTHQEVLPSWFCSWKAPTTLIFRPSPTSRWIAIYAPWWPSPNSKGLKVVIATMPPVCGDLSFLKHRIEGFQPISIRLLIDFFIPLADVFGYFVSTPNWETALLSTDPITGCEHPNDAGYAVMKQAFLDQINTLDDRPPAVISPPMSPSIKKNTCKGAHPCNIRLP